MGVTASFCEASAKIAGDEELLSCFFDEGCLLSLDDGWGGVARDVLLGQHSVSSPGVRDT